jgi:hypothetical protein
MPLKFHVLTPLRSDEAAGAAGGGAGALVVVCVVVGGVVVVVVRGGVVVGTGVAVVVGTAAGRACGGTRCAWCAGISTTAPTAASAATAATTGLAAACAHTRPNRCTDRAPVDTVGHLGPGQPPGRLQPPQRQQFAVRLVQPAGGLGQVPPLVGQVQPGDGEVDEVGARVGDVVGQVARPLLGPVPVAHLPHRDDHQPGPETGRIAQSGQPVQGTHHGVLHHVVHVRVAVHGPADDVVDERQVTGGQGGKRAAVTVARGDDGGQFLVGTRRISHHD